MIQSLNASNEQVDLPFDAISEHCSAPKCAETLDAFGGGKLCLKLPYTEYAKRPEGVVVVETFAAKIVINKKFGSWLLTPSFRAHWQTRHMCPALRSRHLTGDPGGTEGT